MYRPLFGALVLLLVLSGCSAQETRGDGEPTAAATVSTAQTESACSGPEDACLEIGVLAAPDSAGQAETRVRVAQEAFWARVNEQGGVGGKPVVLRQGAAVDGEELAFLAASESSAPRLDGLPANVFVAGTLPLSSRWLFQDRVLQTGGSVCTQAMNAVDVLAFRGTDVGSVAVLHLGDELGRDAAAGAELAASRREIPFTALRTAPGQDQESVVSQIDELAPDVVVLALSPAETGVIVADLVERGFRGELITTSPGWERSLMDGPSADVLAERLVTTASWREFSLASVGHGAMRTALGDIEADDAYTAGWIGNYPLLELLRAADKAGDLTRAGLVDAAAGLDDVDYEGMYPPAIGTPFSGGPTEHVAVRSVFRVPDPESPTSAHTIEDYFNGLTMANHEFRQPCFEGR